MKIAILSLGNLGSGVAQLLASNGHQVMVWEHDLAVVNEVNSLHRNSRYLPDIELHPSIQATNDISMIFSFGEMLINCLPTRFILPVLEPVAKQLPQAIPIVNMSKGFNSISHKTAMQLLAEVFPQHRMAMLCGPSLANEFVRGMNTAVVAASSDNTLPLLIKSVMDNAFFSVLPSTDVTGVELGGIFKNAYAVGMGFASSINRPGRNFVGAYFTQALKEMCLIGCAMGAEADSFYHLSGLGDLLATSLSDKSHNFTAGKLLGEGLSLHQVEVEAGVLPEGVNTLRVMQAIAENKGLALPLIQLLQQVLEQGFTPAQFFQRFNACLQ